MRGHVVISRDLFGLDFVDFVSGPIPWLPGWVSVTWYSLDVFSRRQVQSGRLALG